MPNSLDLITSRPTSQLRKTKSGGVSNKLPHQVLRRNERERKRVQQVNLGFIHLRDRVPNSNSNKKLSKVETLREAARYIQFLSEILQNTSDKSNCPMPSTISSLSYPIPSTSHDNYYCSQSLPDCHFSSPSDTFSPNSYYTPIADNCGYRPNYPMPYSATKFNSSSPSSSFCSDGSYEESGLRSRSFMM